MNLTKSLIAILGAAALLAVVLVPGEEPEYAVVVDPQRQQIAQADGRFQLQSELYRRAVGRQRAREAVERVAPSPEQLHFVRPAGVPAEIETRFRKEVLASIAWLPRRDSTMRLVYTFMVDTGGVLDGVPVAPTSSVNSDFFPPGSVAKNVCAVVVHLGDARMVSVSGSLAAGGSWHWWSPRDPLGACMWFAAYGAPGRGVTAWLDSTQYSAVRSRAYAYARWLLPGNPYEMRAAERRIGLRACATTRASAACDRFLLGRGLDPLSEHRQSLGTSGWIGNERVWNPEPNVDAADLLRTIEHELGPSAFARFWQSDDDVPTAFHAVHGGTLSTWISGFAGDAIAADPDRPLPGSSVLATSR